MVNIYRASERGITNIGWLKSAHTFSFGEFHNPARVHFRGLRVLNDDRVAPGRGFGRHPHSDMEIISYVLEGALEHADSIGTGSVIRPGELQVMSAGSGIEHSEWNHSKEEEVHFLQIWIFPNQKGAPPTYQQDAFDREAAGQGFVRMAGPEGPLTLRADASISVSHPTAGSEVSFQPTPGRHTYVHVAKGQVRWGSETLEAGDAVATDEAGLLEFTALADSELLAFDLA